MTNIIMLDEIDNNLIKIKSAQFIENMMFSKIKYDNKNIIINIPKCKLVESNKKQAVFKLESRMVKSFTIFEDFLIHKIEKDLRDAGDLFYKNIQIDSVHGIVLKINSESSQYSKYIGKIVDLYLRPIKIKCNKHKIVIIWNISDIHPNNCLIDYDDDNVFDDLVDNIDNIDNIDNNDIGPYLDEFEDTKNRLKERIGCIEDNSLIQISKLNKEINRSKEKIENFKMEDNITNLAESIDNIEHIVNTFSILCERDLKEI